MDDMETKTAEIGAEAEEERILKSRQITEEVINYVVEKISRAFDPEKIIVFGSAANGEPSKANDLDILVVMESDRMPYERGIIIDRLLRGRKFSIDPHVITPAEMELSIKDKNWFLREILETGRIMYERKSA